MSPGLLDSDSPSLSLVSVNIPQLTLSGCGSKKSDLDLFGDLVPVLTIPESKDNKTEKDVS
jgi:hypothetical protein